MAQQPVCTLAQEIPAVELTVDVISDLQQFVECRDKWNRLVAESHVQHPFVSHAWLTTWWEHFGADKTLQVFIVKSGDEWLAAAPMMAYSINMYGVPVRRLDSIYNYHVPRSEFLIRDRSEAVYDALWQAMSQKSAPWDVVALQQFLSDSPTLTRFRRMAESSGWHIGDWEAPASPYIPLDCSHDEVLNRLSSRMRQTLRKRQTKLENIAVVDMETVTDAAEIPSAMEEGLRIEAAAWKGSAGTAINSDPRVADFYTALAFQAAELGTLKLIFLRVGGKRIAFNYVLEVEGVLYGLKIGYDPDYQEYSPGNILRNLVLKDACERGCTEYDFLGNPDDWKLSWTSHLRPQTWLFLFRNRPLSSIVYHAKFNVLPAVRRNNHLMKLSNSLMGLVQCSQSNE